RLRSFYLRPLDRDVLARYGKFEQLIYLPYLGRVLARLLRWRGESGHRIFVWGNFIQLHHYTGSPAVDSYIHYAMGPWDDRTLEPIYDSIIGGLMDHQPRYLVRAYPDLDVEALRDLTGLHFVLVKTVLARFPIYRLEEFNPPQRHPLSLPWKEKQEWLERLTHGPHMPGVADADLVQGRARRALAECRKLVTLNKWDRDGWIFLGELCTQFGLHAQAAGIYGKLLRWHPRLPHLRLLLASVRVQLKSLQIARDLIDDEIRLFGASLSTEASLGHLEKARQDGRKAIDHFQNACVLAPDQWDLRLAQAACYEQEGEPPAARKRYLEVFKRAAGSRWEGVRAQAATGLARLGRAFKTESETLAALRGRDPENGPLTYAYASALEREGCAAEARLWFDTLTRTLSPDLLKASAWFRLARLTAPQDRAPCIAECLKLNPYHSGVRRLKTSKELSYAQA
ncbi:MAG: tetratricopeptide repeat protein, partial [Nitrospinaceae bacterium]